MSLKTSQFIDEENSAGQPAATAWVATEREG